MLEGASDDDGLAGVYGGAPTPATGLSASAPTPGAEVSLKKRLLSGSSVPATPGLAAALGGDSDDDDGGAMDFGGGYGSEEAFSGGYGSDLVIDEVDTAKIFAMPELDREMLLVERAERRAKWKAKRDLSRRKAEAERKARGERDSDDAQASRKRGSKADALTDIRQRRERLKQRSARRAARGESDDDDDDDHRRSDEESDGAWGGGSRKRRDSKKIKKKSSRRAAYRDQESDYSDEELDDLVHERKSSSSSKGRGSRSEDGGRDPAKVGDVNRSRLTRNTLERWIGQDHAEKALKGFFVRVGAGSRTGGSTYILGRVEGLQEGDKEYQLGGKTTKKVLAVNVANKILLYQMQFVSNSNVLFEEFSRWWHQTHNAGLPVVTVAEVNELVKRARDVENFYADPSRLDKIIAERAAAGELPTNLVREKAQVQAEIMRAEVEGKHDVVAQARRKLDALSERSSGYKEAQNTKFAATNKINAANRRVNQQRYYNFTREQRQKERAAGEKGVSHDSLINSDPFSRVKSTTTFILPKSQEDTAAAAAAAAAAAGEKAGENGNDNGDEANGSAKAPVTPGRARQEVTLKVLHDVDVDMDDLDISDLEDLSAASAPLVVAAGRR